MPWKHRQGFGGLHLLINPPDGHAIPTWLWATVYTKGKRAWIPNAGPLQQQQFLSPATLGSTTAVPEVDAAVFKGPSVFRMNNRPSQVDSSLLTCRYFKTNGALLQQPDFANPSSTVLNESGSNLAWVLSSLMTEFPEKFHLIVSALREVVPVVKRIRSRAVLLKRTEKQTVTVDGQDLSYEKERTEPGQELIFDMLSGDGLPATMVSEGTLVVLAVLTLIHGAKADLIMLDDVELGLHPKAQRDLIRQLRRIQETHPKLQIILSTHSPYVVDEMKPEEVWVFAPDAEGCAVVHRLDEHPNAKRAMEVLTTGEFWSAEGEEWVVNATETEGPGAPAARVAEEPPAA
jgi:predicted ATPase